MRLTPKYYAQAWFSALQDVPAAQWSEVSQRVLQHVYHHGHVKWLPEIIRLIAQLEHRQHGTVPVTVRAAHSLNQETLEQLVKAVLPTIQPVITQQLDAALLGGVQIETEHQRWDDSVAGQLQRLAQLITH